MCSRPTDLVLQLFMQWCPINVVYEGERRPHRKTLFTQLFIHQIHIKALPSSSPRPRSCSSPSPRSCSSPCSGPWGQSKVGSSDRLSLGFGKAHIAVWDPGSRQVNSGHYSVWSDSMCVGAVKVENVPGKVREAKKWRMYPSMFRRDLQRWYLSS